jgi:hypothetical protein
MQAVQNSTLKRLVENAEANSDAITEAMPAASTEATSRPRRSRTAPQ